MVARVFRRPRSFVFWMLMWPLLAVTESRATGTGTVVNFEDFSFGNITCPGDPNCNTPSHSLLLSKGFDILGAPPGYVFVTSLFAGLGSTGKIVGFAEPNHLETHEGLSTGETLTLDFQAGSPAAGPVKSVQVQLAVSPTVSNNNVSSTVTMNAYNASSFLVGTATLSFTGITNNVITDGLISVTRPTYEIATVTLTANPHASGGIYLESVCFEAQSAASSGDALFVCMLNNTGQPAAGLRATFTGAAGNLYVDPGALVAQACLGAPAIPSNPPAVANTVEINWPDACVPPGDGVYFLVRTANGPLAYASGFWTNTGGTNIGAADTCGVSRIGPAPGPPPPPPPPPFGAIKVSSRYKGGLRSYSLWFGLDGCAYRGCWRTARWCFTRVFFCPFANRFDRFFELPVWLPIGPEIHSSFIPAKCYYFKDTLVIAELGGHAGVVGRMPESFSGQDPGAGDPYDPFGTGLDPRYTDDGGVTFRSAVDFTSTFLTVRDSMKIVLNSPSDPLPGPGHPPILQAIGARYAVSAGVLTPLIDEVQTVRMHEPSVTMDYLYYDLQQMQSAYSQIAAALAIPVHSDPSPYYQLQYTWQDMANQIRSVPYSRFANPGASLDSAADAAGDIGNLIVAGIDTDLEDSSFLHLLYNRIPNLLGHFATGMSPHMRVRISIPGYRRFPSSIDGVQVQVKDLSTNEVVDTFVSDLGEFGDFDVPIIGVSPGTSVRIWFKLPTHLARSVDAVVSDGLLITPPSLIPGDANGSNCISGQDLTQVQNDFGEGGSLNPTPPSDVNGDGIVNSMDLSIVNANQGLCGDPPLQSGVGIPEPAERVRIIGATPNPVRTTTSINFDLVESSDVTIRVFDVSGSLVTTVVDRVPFQAGRRWVTFDASRLTAGVYVFSVLASGSGSGGDVELSGKMVVAH